MTELIDPTKELTAHKIASAVFDPEKEPGNYRRLKSCIINYAAKAIFEQRKYCAWHAENHMVVTGADMMDAVQPCLK